MAATSGAGARMLQYLNSSIRLEHFQMMAKQGFTLVRLPLGYWNFVAPSAAPVAPSQTAKRWLAVQQMLSPADYAPYLSRVLRYAAQTNLQVLLDMHGLPGGQSVNQCTGCATECEGDGCGHARHYFNAPANHATGVAAITEMARLCAAHRPTCFGIELLNEPEETTTDRASLVSFYQAAVSAARGEGGLSADVPIVVMDWADRLALFWSFHARSLAATPGAGELLFETHFYSPVVAKSILELEAVMAPLIALLDTFSGLTNQSTFIGEYALDNIDSRLSVESVARWWYTRAAAMTRGRGLAVWNFDGPGGWGAVEPEGAKPRTWWAAVNRASVS